MIKRHTDHPAPERVEAPQSSSGPSIESSNSFNQDLSREDGVIHPFVSGWRAGDEASGKRAAGANVDAQTRGALLAEVARSPTVLALLRQVGTDFPLRWSDKGSYHRNGVIYLDIRQKDWTGTIIHELEHLRVHKKKQAPSLRGTSREDWIDAMIGNEARAHATTYVGMIELGAKKDRHVAGFDEFLAYLRKVAPELLEKQDDPAVAHYMSKLRMDHAQAFVEHNLRTNPKWRTATGGESYEAHYGRYWDEANS